MGLGGCGHIRDELPWPQAGAQPCVGGSPAGASGPGLALPGTAASPGAGGATSQCRRVPPPEERPRAGSGGPDLAGGRARGWARGRGWTWPPVPRANVAPLSPKEMLQEKSLSETEEGFPTAPAPGHADTSAGSPVLGVAGGSTTPLSSPQLPDPEQVRTVRPRVLPCPPAAPSPPPPARPVTAHLPRRQHGEGLRGKLIFLHFFFLLFFIVIILFYFPCPQQATPCPLSVRSSVKGESEHREPRLAGPDGWRSRRCSSRGCGSAGDSLGFFPSLNEMRLL